MQGFYIGDIMEKNRLLVGDRVTLVSATPWLHLGLVPISSSFASSLHSFQALLVTLALRGVQAAFPNLVLCPFSPLVSSQYGLCFLWFVPQPVLSHVSSHRDPGLANISSLFLPSRPEP